MGDVLQGVNARWTFQRGSIRIGPERSLATSRLLERLGERTIPHEAVSGISLGSGRRGTVVLRITPRPGADPVMIAAGGRLDDKTDPYVLVLPRERQAQAERHADAVAAVVERLGAGPAPHCLIDPPSVPRRLKGWDGAATFDGQTARFKWFWSSTSPAKYRRGGQAYDIADIADVEWTPGHLRLHLRGRHSPPDPAKDPAAILLDKGYGPPHESLPFAAAVVGAADTLTAAARKEPARSPVSSWGSPMRVHPDDMVARVRRLGELHRAGLLTDTEFSAKKAELLSEL